MGHNDHEEPEDEYRKVEVEVGACAWCGQTCDEGWLPTWCGEDETETMRIHRECIESYEGFTHACESD